MSTTKVQLDFFFSGSGDDNMAAVIESCNTAKLQAGRGDDMATSIESCNTAKLQAGRGDNMATSIESCNTAKLQAGRGDNMATSIESYTRKLQAGRGDNMATSIEEGCNTGELQAQAEIEVVVLNNGDPHGLPLNALDVSPVPLVLADPKSANKVRLGFLVSGRGGNMAAIIGSCKAGELQAEPAVVVSSNENAYALQWADELGVPSFHLGLSNHESADALDRAIKKVLLEHKVDFLVLAGYTDKVGVHVLRKFGKYAFNIHPSLLPKYGGLGMFGLHVHEQVLQAGERETGATVHLVDAEYDQGEIYAQKTVKVADDDTPQTLAKKVSLMEHKLYTETLKERIKVYFEVQKQIKADFKRQKQSEFSFEQNRVPAL